MEEENAYIKSSEKLNNYKKTCYFIIGSFITKYLTKQTTYQVFYTFLKIEIIFSLIKIYSKTYMNLQKVC